MLAFHIQMRGYLSFQTSSYFNGFFSKETNGLNFWKLRPAVPLASMKEKRYILFTSCLGLLCITIEGKCALTKLISVPYSELKV